MTRWLTSVHFKIKLSEISSASFIPNHIRLTESKLRKEIRQITYVHVNHNKKANKQATYSGWPVRISSHFSPNQVSWEKRHFQRNERMFFPQSCSCLNWSPVATTQRQVMVRTYQNCPISVYYHWSLPPSVTTSYPGLLRWPKITGSFFLEFSQFLELEQKYKVLGNILPVYNKYYYQTVDNLAEEGSFLKMCCIMLAARNDVRILTALEVNTFCIRFILCFFPKKDTDKGYAPG